MLRLGRHASLRPCYAEILPRTRLTLASLAKVRGLRSGLRPTHFLPSWLTFNMAIFSERGVLELTTSLNESVYCVRKA